MDGARRATRARSARWRGLVAIPLLLAGLASALEGAADGDPPVVDVAMSVTNVETWTADRLLSKYGERLEAEGEGLDVEATAAHVERVGAALLPSVTVRQSSRWEVFGGSGGRSVGGPELGLGVSASFPLLDEESWARLDVAEQGLLLAVHNAREEVIRRLEEFRRNLRLLAHLEEVEAILAEHRRVLLELRPAWRALEGLHLEDLGQEEIAYLELVQALDRTQRERGVLRRHVALRTGLEEEQLPSVVGRPPPLDHDRIGSAKECASSSSEVKRAKLLLDEAQLIARADLASRTLRATLDLAGNVRSGVAQQGDPDWAGDLRLSLRVEAPVVRAWRSQFDVDVTPDGIDQRLTLSWPRTEGEQVREEDPHEAFRRTLAETQIAAQRLIDSVAGAVARQRLRELELHRTQQALTTPGNGRSPALLDALAQAELALVNAELEVDLAKSDLALLCGAAG